MHVILTRNMKHLSPQVVQAAEDEWVKKNAKWLEDREAKRTPRRVAAVYCQRLPLEEDAIDAQMNWDFFEEWPEDEPLPLLSDSPGAQASLDPHSLLTQ